MNIEQKVKEIAVEIYCVELSQVTNEARLEDLGDDLDAVEFVTTLEEEFEIDIDDDVVGNVDTIQGFIDLVTNLKGAN